MNKKQLIVAWVMKALPFLMLSLFLTFSSFSYAGNLEPTERIEEKAPEFIIHEKDLTYDSYRDSLKSLTEALDKYQKGKGNELGWEVENIGIPNRLLRIEGYGFKTQRDIIRLELENAKLRRADKGEVADLESKLKEAEKRLKDFLASNIWVD